MSERLFRFPSNQGITERIPYTFDAALWGVDAPTSPVIKVYNEAGLDITATATSGSASISGSVITFPLIIDLPTARHSFRVTLSFLDGTAKYTGYGYLFSEDP